MPVASEICADLIELKLSTWDSAQKNAKSRARFVIFAIACHSESSSVFSAISCRVTSTCVLAVA